MNIKEKLLQLRKQILGESGVKESLDNNLDTKENIIEDKVEEFIIWYKEALKKNYNSNYEKKVLELRRFIEKMAIWYELRYPDYELDKCISNHISVDEIMFKENGYIKDLLGEDVDTNYLDWAPFYNAQVFIKALPDKQKDFLKKPTYSEFVYISRDTLKYLEVSKKGIIINADRMYRMEDGKRLNFSYKFVSKHIKEAKEIAIKYGFMVDDSIDKEIESYEQKSFI